MGAFGGTVTLLGFRPSANIGAKCAFKRGRRPPVRIAAGGSGCGGVEPGVAAKN
jgi:hypothetical protein